MSAESFRNHLLAASMLRRWETLSEMIIALRKNYGMRVTRIEATEWLFRFAKDGAHDLSVRKREGTTSNEYQLCVKPSEIAETPVYVRPTQSKPLGRLYPVNPVDKKKAV